MQDFWTDLRSIMTPSGALAVNFAGVQRSEAASVVISTLLASFPSCKAFRDTHGESADLTDDSLRNMVCHSQLSFRFARPSKIDELLLSAVQSGHLLYRIVFEAHHVSSP